MYIIQGTVLYRPDCSHNQNGTGRWIYSEWHFPSTRYTEPIFCVMFPFLATTTQEHLSKPIYCVAFFLASLLIQGRYHYRKPRLTLSHYITTIHPGACVDVDTDGAGEPRWKPSIAAPGVIADRLLAWRIPETYDSVIRCKGKTRPRKKALFLLSVSHDVFHFLLSLVPSSTSVSEQTQRIHCRQFLGRLV
jgi:hypothetical protein